MEANKEEWKDVVGYEGLYKVSNSGTVVSFPKTWLSGRWVVRTNPEQEMKYSVDRKGYHILGLRKDGKLKMHKVHRLVALAFIPNPDNKPVVNHKDGTRNNNNVSNLEWTTHQENSQHYIGLKGYNATEAQKEAWEKIVKAKRKPVFCPEDNLQFRTIREAADHYGIHREALRRALDNGKQIGSKTFLSSYNSNTNNQNENNADQQKA